VKIFPDNRVGPGDLETVATPVGEWCVRCQETIDARDRGFILPCVERDGSIVEQPWHYLCFLVELGVPQSSWPCLPPVTP
jgi:hypothetical protein